MTYKNSFVCSWFMNHEYYLKLIEWATGPACKVNWSSLSCNSFAREIVAQLLFLNVWLLCLKVWPTYREKNWTGSQGVLQISLSFRSPVIEWFTCYIFILSFVSCIGRMALRVDEGINPKSWPLFVFNTSICRRILEENHYFSLFVLWSNEIRSNFEF